MKISFKPLIINLAIIFIAASCQKENLSSTTVSPVTAASIQAAALQTNAIAVSASATTKGDSVYAVNACGSFEHIDSIAFSSLPSAITSYLATNYSGYTQLKAFSTKDSSGAITGYIAVVQFSGNPVAIKFDTNGAFVKVLELREGIDLLGRGYHEGGCFENRDGKQKDTIALSALPAGITSYFSSNYSQDTLVKASKTREGNYLVLSKNNNLFATAFDSAGTFISRIQLPSVDGYSTALNQNALPSNILSYLSTTYPGYVFDKAFSITINGVLQGYSVVIDANNIKYGIQFDAAGNFVKVKLIRL